MHHFSLISRQGGFTGDEIAEEPGISKDRQVAGEDRPRKLRDFLGRHWGSHGFWLALVVEASKSIKSQIKIKISSFSPSPSSPLSYS